MCSLCNKEGHLEKDCPQDRLPELENLPNLTENWKIVLNSICVHIIGKFRAGSWIIKIGFIIFDFLTEENQQSKKEEKERNDLLKKIREIVCKRFAEAKLSLFGSSNNGFGMKKSDLDICMTLDGTYDKRTNGEVAFLNFLLTMTNNK